MFSELRSAVHNKRIGDTVFCILRSDDRDQALKYALDALPMNMKHIIEFIVACEPTLVERLNRQCTLNVMHEFLCWLAQCIFVDPITTPSLTIEGLSFGGEPYCLITWSSTLREWHINITRSASHSKAYVSGPAFTNSYKYRGHPISRHLWQHLVT